jgi:hypothetical protein
MSVTDFEDLEVGGVVKYQVERIITPCWKDIVSEVQKKEPFSL